jgi:hypothetical protein
VVAGLGLAPTIVRAALLAEAAGGTKLPPPTKAAAMMALLGIALLGMLLIVVVLLGGHWVRRQGGHRRGPSVPPDRRPLTRNAVEPLQPDGEADIDEQPPAGETLHDGPSNHGETKSP